MHGAENLFASRVPVHEAAVCGAFHRRSPVGGAAYGMPLYTRTCGFVPGAPESSPPVMRIGSSSAASGSTRDSNASELQTECFISLRPRGLFHQFDTNLVGAFDERNFEFSPEN